MSSIVTLIPMFFFPEAYPHVGQHATMLGGHILNYNHILGLDCVSPIHGRFYQQSLLKWYHFIHIWASSDKEKNILIRESLEECEGRSHGPYFINILSLFLVYPSHRRVKPLN